MNKDKIEQLEKSRRVYQVAKELNIASGELLDYLKERNYHVKNMNIMTRIDEKIYNEIMIKFHPENNVTQLFLSLIPRFAECCAILGTLTLLELISSNASI